MTPSIDNQPRKRPPSVAAQSARYPPPVAAKPARAGGVFGDDSDHEENDGRSKRKKLTVIKFDAQELLAAGWTAEQVWTAGNALLFFHVYRGREMARVCW